MRDIYPEADGVVRPKARSNESPRRLPSSKGKWEMFRERDQRVGGSKGRGNKAIRELEGTRQG